MPAVLEVRDLVKHYPRVRAVDGVSFEVQEGTCFGLLGPNGAGKSTTIEMLEGLLKPTSGQVLFRGAALGGHYRERVGIQFQNTALQEHLTTRENLRFFSALYPKRRPLDELIALCRLEEFLDRDTSKLSGGQRQRLLLAIALVNEPEVLFLDEPTTGLDPQARRNFWDLVQGVKAQGKTIVLTTHYMEEADELCDRLAIIDHGKILVEDTPAALKASIGGEKIYDLRMREIERSAALESKLSGMQGVTGVEPIEGGLRVLAKAQDGLLANVVTAASEFGLRDVTTAEPSLETVFIRLTGRELRE